MPFNANVPKKGWQINHKATDDLRHLQEFRLLSVVDGKMKIPNGEFFDLDGEIAPKYLHFSSFNYDFYKKDGSLIKVPIQILRDSEFSLIESSEINIPTKRFPKARVLDDVIEVVPNSILSVYLGYLRQPKEASWGYVLENERPVYDESISKDIDAPVEAFNDVALLTLNLMGINLRDGELSQYSQAKTQEGLWLQSIS